jgi:hypothetical protein
MELWWIYDNHEVLQTLAACVGAVGGVVGMFVAVFAWLAARASAESAKISADTSRMAERAYVRMSHLPPGLVFAGRASEEVSVTVKISNSGRTPANITAVGLTLWTDRELPKEPPDPDPAKAQTTAFFLSADDHFFVSRAETRPIPLLDEIRNSDRPAWLFGYVDYTDTFGRRHRSGYARRHDPNQANNLVFETKAGYNYDQEKRP